MQFKPRSARLVALLTGLTLASTIFGAPSARAADKSKNWKYGAIGLGVAGAYLLSKGKVAPAAAAAAGGYYAYKKGEDIKHDNRYGYNNGGRNDYGRNGNYGRGNDPRSGSYGNSGNYGGYGNGGYGNNGGYNGNYGNGGYNNGGYNTNAGRDVYPDGNSGYGNYPEYRANADKRDNRRDNKRDRRDRAGNYDLSPYLRQK